MGLSFLISREDKKAIGENGLESILEVYTKRYQLNNCSAEISCIDPVTMQELNLQYRQFNKPTDVLSFPTFANLEKIQACQNKLPLLIGSIIICPEIADAYQETLLQLVHHGLLHLLGFDHEQNPDEWQQEEDAILSELTKSGLNIKGLNKS